MITERDLVEAIAECQGERNPNANTCIKLAAYLTIKDSLYPQEKVQEMPSYSYAVAPVMNEDYFSDSDFSQIVKDAGIERAYSVIDELMSTLAYINPKLYDSVIRKLKNL